MRLYGLSLMCVIGLVVGCGGNGGGGDNGLPSRIDIIGQAPSHGLGQGISQMTGFVGGQPAFLSFNDEDHWSVQVVGVAPVDLVTTPYAHAALLAFDNGYAVGYYDSGVFAYRLTQNGWVAATYPGVEAAVLDSVRGKLVAELTGGGHAIVDIATGVQTPITLPDGAPLYFAKAGFLVYGVSGTSFKVRNLDSNAEWTDLALPSDTNAFPYALNENGGVIGISDNGAATSAVYWEPVTAAPISLHFVSSGIVEPGWISPDGSKAIINVHTDEYRSYIWVDGAIHPIANIPGGDAVPYVYGLNETGTFGFGFGDSSADPDSGVAIQITYH